MATADGSCHWGWPLGSGTGRGQAVTSSTQMGQIEHSMSVPPFMNSVPDPFLRRLLTPVVQVVRDTITQTLFQEREPRDDLGCNLIKIEKMSPPEFEGSTEPGDVLDWMIEMEKLFAAFVCPEGHKVAIATHYLKKAAYDWWEACKPKDHDPNWDEFKDKMERRYYPPALRSGEEDEIFRPRPQGETVDEAAKIFYRIFRINPKWDKDEKTKISLFERRMSDEIRKDMMGHSCKTLEKYVTEALNAEAAFEAVYGDWSSKRRKTEPSDYSGRRCFNCGSDEHLKADCSYPLRNCLGCGKLGHMVAFCRQRRNQM